MPSDACCLGTQTTCQIQGTKNSACLRFQSRDDCFKNDPQHIIIIITPSWSLFLWLSPCWLSPFASECDIQDKSMETNFQNGWKTNVFIGCNHNSSLYPGPFHSIFFRQCSFDQEVPLTTLLHINCDISSVLGYNRSRAVGLQGFHGIWPRRKSIEIQAPCPLKMRWKWAGIPGGFLVPGLDGQGPPLGKNVFSGTS